MPQIDHSDSLIRLNAVRVIIVLVIAFGYASTMPIGPGNPELFAHLGYDPSWIGIQALFFFSGFLALRSIRRHGSAIDYLRSRFIRNMPLLALFTLVTVLIIYPALNTATEPLVVTVKKLGLYFIYTVSCLDPGRTLPGLLDEANYICLIQGAVWTFKWGLVAHLAAAAGTQLHLFDNNRIVLTLAVLVTLLFACVFYLSAKIDMPLLETPALALRLAYPFLIGMAVFAYQDKLPTSPLVRTSLLTFFAGMAFIWHSGVFMWTPIIEISLTAFWVYSAFLLAMSKTPALRILENWPNLALGLYLVNWPTSQLLMLAFPEITPWGLIALSLPISLCIALAAYALLSKHSYAYASQLSRLPVSKPHIA
ncbi:MAG: hypothetical protein ACSHXY_15415 [Alphaproteobacteria bacterium]